MSTMLGALAGFGDYARKKNEQDRADEKDARDRFVADLERIMDSDDWPEEGRLAAADARYQVYSNPKIKRKDYEKLWQQIRESTRRPGVPGAEVAAARAEVPALQSLQTRLSANATRQYEPSAASDSLTMRPRSREDTLEFLKPPAFDQNGQTPNPFTGANLTLRGETPAPITQPTPVEGPAVTQRLTDQTAQRVVALQPTATQATPELIGPYTRAEKNKMSMDMFRKQNALEMEAYAQKKQIDRQFAPDEWEYDWHRNILINKSRGTFKVAEGAPEIQDDGGDAPLERQLIRAMKAEAEQRGLDITDPSVEKSILLAAREELLKLGRDPNIAAMREEIMSMRRDNMQFQQNQAQSKYEYDATKQITDDYEREAKTAVQGSRYARDIRRAAAMQSRGGDFLSLYRVVQISDPNSVVREGELHLLMSMLSHMANLERMWNKADPRQKAALAKEARVLALDVASLVETSAKETVTLANQRAEARASQVYRLPLGALNGVVVEFKPDGSLGPKQYPIAPIKRPMDARSGGQVQSTGSSSFDKIFSSIVGPTGNQ